MVKILECKICGHTGNKQNPLCIQGLYRLPYCCNCMNEACRKAANDPIIKAIDAPHAKKK